MCVCSTENLQFLWGLVKYQSVYRTLTKQGSLLSLTLIRAVSVAVAQAALGRTECIQHEQQQDELHSTGGNKVPNQFSQTH